MIRAATALRVRIVALAVCLAACVTRPCFAQQGQQLPPVNAFAAQSPMQSSADTNSSQDDSSDAAATLFPHSKKSRFWISGQANIILQWHPAFTSPYSGPNSLSAAAQSATSRVFTLYTGVQLTQNTEILFDPESAGGAGIGAALGLAGFTNLDVVRNPELGPTPYVARIFLHQVIPLSKEREASERGPFDLETSKPVRRIDFRIGKFSLADFFDANSAGSDSHLQFLNWTIDNNGGWDYAADTRGYTFAAEVEYHDRWGAIRFAEALMPTVANGIHLDGDLRRARSENLELEFHPTLFRAKPTIVRLLGYANTGNMGSYRAAINAFLAGETSRPDVIATRERGRVKYGFGVNLEQPLNGWVTAFARWGWNEGHNESFVYTEVNETVSLGAAASGDHWKRKLDHLGAAFVANGISGDHQRYLELGGLGFLLGDGRLSYGQEKIFEAFYTAHIWRGLFAAFDLQHINNPGYNRDRGPLFVPALRAHIDF